MSIETVAPDVLFRGVREVPEQATRSVRSRIQVPVEVSAITVAVAK